MQPSCIAHRSHSRLRSRLFASLAALLGLSPLVTFPSAHAQTFNWTGDGGSNSWSASSNWSGGVPYSSNTGQLIFGAVDSSKKNTSNDLTGLTLALLQLNDSGYNLGGNGLTFAGASARIVQTGSGSNAIANNFSFTSLTVDVQNSSGSLTLSGAISNVNLPSSNLNKIGDGTLLLTSTNIDPHILSVNGGTLLIASGGRVGGTTGYVGVTPGSNATATLDGAGNQWNMSGYLSVGGQGVGTLNIRNGATVSDTIAFISSQVGVATVNVSGSGTTWNHSQDLAVGSGGNGLVRITDGAVVTSSRGIIGNTSNVQGEIVVDGVGSRWNTGNFEVGTGGTGILRITGGATVQSTYCTMGYADVSNLALGNGSVIVDGAGSQWITGETNVSFNTTATLRITGGASVIGSGGTHINQRGTLVANNGSLSGSIDGNGVVQVTGNGLLLNQVFNTTFAGTIQDGTGAGQFTKTGTGRLTLSGTSTHTGGTTVQNGTLALAATGALAGNVQVAGGTLANNGTIGGFTTVASGATARGNGNYAGGYLLQSGSTIQFGDNPRASSPGALRSGSATWNGGSTLFFQISDATGIAGTNWSLTSITGNLSIAPNASPFTINLQSLLANGTMGQLAHFSAAQNYSWLFASATDGISGFNAASFVFNTTDFAAFNTGTTNGVFSISQSGNTLRINYTVVPEINTGLLLMLGSTTGLIGWFVRRRTDHRLV